MKFVEMDSLLFLGNVCILFESFLPQLFGKSAVKPPGLGYPQFVYFQMLPYLKD
jgi:hypothetical protein